MQQDAHTCKMTRHCTKTAGSRGEGSWRPTVGGCPTRGGGPDVLVTRPISKNRHTPATKVRLRLCCVARQWYLCRGDPVCRRPLLARTPHCRADAARTPHGRRTAARVSDSPVVCKPRVGTCSVQPRGPDNAYPVTGATSKPRPLVLSEARLSRHRQRRHLQLTCLCPGGPTRA